jgi:hypothetical protein
MAVTGLAVAVRDMELEKWNMYVPQWELLANIARLKGTACTSSRRRGTACGRHPPLTVVLE